MCSSMLSIVGVLICNTVIMLKIICFLTLAWKQKRCKYIGTYPGGRRSHDGCCVMYLSRSAVLYAHLSLSWRKQFQNVTRITISCLFQNIHINRCWSIVRPTFELSVGFSKRWQKRAALIYTIEVFVKANTK